MNRFSRKNSLWAKLKKIQLPLIAFIVLFILFIYGVSLTSSMTYEKQAEGLKDAIQKSVVHCYAVEGTYPPNLTYLEEHYGITYDKDLFFVDYQSIGSNILPDITIIPKK